MQRELSYRTIDQGNTRIRLIHDDTDDTILISVAQGDPTSPNGNLTVTTIPKDKALDAFYHPYCYVN